MNSYFNLNSDSGTHLDLNFDQSVPQACFVPDGMSSWYDQVADVQQAYQPASRLIGRIKVDSAQLDNATEQPGRIVPSLDSLPGLYSQQLIFTSRFAEEG